MMYYLYRLGRLLALSLPLSAGYFIAIVLARLYCFFSVKDRLALKENLKMILNDKADKKLVKHYSRSIFINFAKYLVDFLRFSKLDRDYIDKFIDIEGIQYIDIALKNKNGAILLSSHLGNWELGGAVLSLLGYPIYAIALDHADRRVNNFFKAQRRISGFRVISIGIGLKKCFKILGENKLLAILGDRDFTENGEKIEFFGKETLIPRGPAVFSLRTRAPIIPGFMVRQKNNKFKFVFEKPINYTPTGNDEQDIKNLISLYIKVVEKYIREYPEQWYVFRNIWNNV